MCTRDIYPLYSFVNVQDVSFAQGIHVVIGYSPRRSQPDTVDLILWNTDESDMQSPLVICTSHVTRAPVGTSVTIRHSRFQSECDINSFNHELQKNVEGRTVTYNGEELTVRHATLIGFVPYVDKNGNIVTSSDHWKQIHRVVFTNFYTGYMDFRDLTNAPF